MPITTDYILALHNVLQGATTEREKAGIQKRIGGTDMEIDSLVYDLHGLKGEEIEIVERNS